MCWTPSYTGQKTKTNKTKNSQRNVLDTTAAKQTQHYVLDTTAAKQTQIT